MVKKNLASKYFQQDYSFILIFITLNIAISLFIVGNYGVSTDEPLSWEFGTEALKNYFGEGKIVDVDYSHGGGFLIPARIGQLFFSFLFPNWVEPYSWHIVYFLVFQLSVFFIFLLAKKFVSNWGGNFAALLYSTQPVLWGHAFINPKDTPFTTLFLGAVLLGINLADSAQDHSGKFSSFLTKIKAGFSIDKKKLYFAAKLTIVILLACIYIFLHLGTATIHNWIETLITTLYTADPSTLLGKIFSSLASNAQHIGLRQYVDKGVRFYDQQLNRVNISLFIIIFLCGFYWSMPKVTGVLLNSVRKILSIKNFFFAALLLGMCAAARTMGAFVILVICMYWFIKYGLKPPYVLLAYLVVAILIMVILWPDLWSTPVDTYLIYMKNVFGFEKWNAKILFEGRFYNKNTYPNYLLPKLISLQLTEPTLILAGTGLVIAAAKAWRKEYDWILSSLVGGWIIAPVILAVFLHPVIYNGFRHFLFILPPIFIFSAITIDFVFTKLQSKLWRIAIIILLLLPGIIGVIQLHPYEYIYFNSFAGGVDGAFREYELDYWLIAYRESIEYINENAPQDATVSPYYGADRLPWFTRQDIQLRGRIRTTTPEGIDYVIVTTNLNYDLLLIETFPKMEQLYTVERDGIPLAVVYKFIEN
jgi:hypothetical protein